MLWFSISNLKFIYSKTSWTHRWVIYEEMRANIYFEESKKIKSCDVWCVLVTGNNTIWCYTHSF